MATETTTSGGRRDDICLKDNICREVALLPEVLILDLDVVYLSATWESGKV